MILKNLINKNQVISNAFYKWSLFINKDKIKEQIQFIEKIESMNLELENNALNNNKTFLNKELNLNLKILNLITLNKITSKNENRLLLFKFFLIWKTKKSANYLLPLIIKKHNLSKSHHFKQWKNKLSKKQT